ncbi:hypothetical protein Pcinc_017075 [Petrolisthes cinctipes]|uniref:Fibronectin type-III domain-containing protein n=1 Tax=Petrolisthes cinctipes TaxID=88211 RepID=A0AAE1FUW7_PETCI|nr:hypothetical protein Pcinc_017075 [Petrolisthes cinctipes]
MAWMLRVALLVWLAMVVASSDDSRFKCFPFSRSDSLGKGSNAKRLARQQKRAASNCPGSDCVAIHPSGDIVAEVGTPYEAECMFDPTRVKAEEVYFQSRAEDNHPPRQFPHIIVDNSTIRMKMNHSEGTKYILGCMLGERPMCERSVFIGYMPQDVKNFSCISHNWTTLNCTWSSPDNPVKVNYTLTYVVPGFLDTRTCPKTEEGKDWCFWNESHFYKRNNWVITFIATSAISPEVIMYNHTISTWAAVIPERAANFVAYATGPREVNLTWTLPHPIDVFPGNVTLEVKYRTLRIGVSDVRDQSPWHLDDMWEMKPKQFHREVFNKVIDNLYPYVEYEFQVRLHTGTGAIRDHMWSKPAFAVNTTTPTRPTRAPKTTRGMFVVEETRYSRNINLMWQEVDPLYWNAPNFHYTITVYNERDGRFGSPLSKVDGVTETFHILRNLSNDIPYRFEVMPVNSEGFPEELNLTSSLVVPEMSAILRTPPYFRVIAYQGHGKITYSVRWRLPEWRDHVESVTIYWCKQLEYENSCKTKLNWKVLDNPTSGAENLTNFDSSGRYMFGISLESHNSSSGIKWSSCIANHGDRPPRIEDFTHSYITSTSVALRWELNCKAQAADPRGFNISYCRVPSVNTTCSSADEEFVLINKESVTRKVVENLRPYTRYTFSIATLTDVGLSHWSRTLSVTTEPDKPSGPPLQMRDTEKGQGWVLLTWNPPRPEDRNGKIIAYEVGGDYPYVGSATVFTESEEATHNFTNLDAWTDYTFKVRACCAGRQEEERLCSDEAGFINIRTNIGKPGKMGAIEQMSNSEVGWDFDDCNGPNCSFELRYKVNGTAHIQEISAGRVSTNISGLNISCSEEQNEVSISMRAVGWDENNSRLDGPWSKKQLVCFPPGSYRNNDIPSLRPQLPQNTFNIYSPTSNQYFSFPIVLGHRRNQVVWFPVNLHQVSFVTNPHEQQHSGSSGTAQPLIRDEESLIEGWDREQEQGIGNQGDTNHNNVNYRDSQIYSKYWPSIIMRSISPEVMHLLHREAHVSPSYIRSRNSYQVPHTEVRDSGVGSGTIERLSTLNGPNSIGSAGQDHFHQAGKSRVPSHSTNSVFQEEPSNNRDYQLGRSCPLIELMRAEGAQVSLNADSEKFELNIKGNSNIFKLLQGISSIPQLTRDHSHVSEFISARTGGSISAEAPTEEVSRTSSLVEGDPQFEEMREDPNSLRHNINIKGDQSFIDSEREMSFPVESQANDTDSEGIIVGIEDLSHASALSRQVEPYISSEDAVAAQNYSADTDYIFLSVNNSVQNHSFSTEEVLEDSEFDASRTHNFSETLVFRDQHSIPRNVKVPSTGKSKELNNSTETTVTNGAEAARGNGTHGDITPQQLENPVNDNSSSVSHSESEDGHRLRRSTGLQTPMVEPINSNLPSSDSYDGDSSLHFTPQKTQELMFGKESDRVVETHQTLKPIISHASGEELDIYSSLHVSQQFHGTTEEQDLGNFEQLKTSAVYHLGPIGSFNGIVGRVVSQLMDEELADRETGQAASDPLLTSKAVAEPISLSEENRGDLNEEREFTHTQPKSVHGAPCPFKDLDESEDMILKIHSYDNEEFELNVQGSGQLHEVIGKLLHGLQSEVGNENQAEENEILVAATDYSSKGDASNGLE